MGTYGPEFLAWNATTRQAWTFRPSLRWLDKHDNGHANSIGFIVGHDLSFRQIETFVRLGRATAVDYDTAMTPRRW
jgi:hypothetical protein